MDLSHNELYGPIPRRFGNLAALRTLNLNNNRLTGAVPAELGNLSGLRTLRLNGNAYLAGPLPLSFTQLNLEVLALEGTALCVPPIPEFNVWLNSLPIPRLPDCDPAEWPFPVTHPAVHGPARVSRWKNYRPRGMVRWKVSGASSLARPCPDSRW